MSVRSLALTPLFGIALFAVLPLAACAQTYGHDTFTRTGSVASHAYASDVRVRIWGPRGRDVFRPGQAIRLNFQTSRDAYVAVVHIDTDGRLDFLFPYGPWANERVRGGRTYTLPAHSGRFVPRGRSGIGYVYVIASPVPLDFRDFDTGGSGFGFHYFGYAVRGDPFYALDLITESLVVDPYRVPYATDLYSYHIGRQHYYPTYACYSGPGVYHTGYWYVHYRPCGAVQGLLRGYPHYYDTRVFRGDRRGFQRGLRAADTRIHRFKEDPRVGTSSAPRATQGERPEPRGVAPAAGTRGTQVESGRPEPRQGAPRYRPEAEDGQRPVPDARPRAEPRPEPRARPRLERRRSDDPPAARPSPPVRSSDDRPAARPSPPARSSDDRPAARPSPPARSSDDRPAARPSPPVRSSDDRPAARPTPPRRDTGSTRSRPERRPPPARSPRRGDD